MFVNGIRRGEKIQEVYLQDKLYEFDDEGDMRYTMPLFMLENTKVFNYNSVYNRAVIYAISESDETKALENDSDVVATYKWYVSSNRVPRGSVFHNLDVRGMPTMAPGR